MADMLPRVLTLDDLTTLLRISRRTVERWVTAERRTGVRHLPSAIPGLKHRYLREDVERWLRTGLPATRRRRGQKVAA